MTALHLPRMAGKPSVGNHQHIHVHGHQRIGHVGFWSINSPLYASNAAQWWARWLSWVLVLFSSLEYQDIAQYLLLLHTYQYFADEDRSPVWDLHPSTMWHSSSHTHWVEGIHDHWCKLNIISVIVLPTMVHVQLHVQPAAMMQSTHPSNQHNATEITSSSWAGHTKSSQSLGLCNQHQYLSMASKQA